MEKILLTLIILSSCLAVIDAELVRATASFSQDSYNVGEDVSVLCFLEYSQLPSIGYTMNWYKKQDAEFLMVGHDANVLQSPFSESANKYTVGFTIDRRTTTAQLYLNITGVEAVDTGEYKCAVGYSGEEQTESNAILININVKAESAQLKLTTSATLLEGKYQFDKAESISCEGEAESLATSTSLVMTLKDGTEITQDFVNSRNVEWTGARGLKLPKTYFRLNADSWKPDTPGNNAMSCYFVDGKHRLIVNTFEFAQTEKPMINCTSNHKEVRIDDLNVRVTCNVFQYSGSRIDVTFRWNFKSGGENVTLNNGETKYLRRAENTEDEYRLIIPRITKDMVSTGKTFEYKVELYKKENEETVAMTTFALKVDSRGRIYNSAQRYNSGSFALAITPVLVLIAGNL